MVGVIQVVLEPNPDKYSHVWVHTNMSNDFVVQQGCCIFGGDEFNISIFGI